MTIPRIARANLTAAMVAKLHWRRYTEHGGTPRHPAHLLTVLGSDTERGTVFVLECRADRGDAHRYCALFEPCAHATTDYDYGEYGDGDRMWCQDSRSGHIMFNANVAEYLQPGWHRDTRRCRFTGECCDLAEAVSGLKLRRGIYVVEVSDVDWRLGEVGLTVLATVGEPAQPCEITVQATSAAPFRFGAESDLRDILEAELPEDADYDPETGVVTVNVDSAVYELMRYLDGRPPDEPAAPPLETSRARPIATINTGGLL